MSCRPKHPSFPALLDTQFWWVELFICGLLPRGGSEGPYLGEVPHHYNKKQNRVYFSLL